MKLGKIENNSIILIDIENGLEVGGVQTEEELYSLGFKKACLTDKPSGNAIERWEEYQTCIVQFWDDLNSEF